MTKKPKRNAPAPRASEPVTLATVLAGLERAGKLAPTRRRDLRSAVKRVAILLGDEPAAIPLDMGAISARLAAVNPVAVGMTRQALRQYPLRLPGGRKGQRHDAGQGPRQVAVERRLD